VTTLKIIHIATFPVLNKKQETAYYFIFQKMKLNTNFSSRDNLKY